MRLEEEKKELHSSLEQLKADFSLSDEELLAFLQKRDFVPLSVFSDRKFSGLQALVAYLKEQRKYTFSKIARVLGRDPRTIWATYAQAKNRGKITVGKTDTYIPLSLFKNRQISILEHLVLFLKKEYTLTEISRLLRRSPTTISTALGRAKDKGVRP